VTLYFKNFQGSFEKPFYNIYEVWKRVVNFLTGVWIGALGETGFSKI